MRAVCRKAAQSAGDCTRAGWIANVALAAILQQFQPATIPGRRFRSLLFGRSEVTLQPANIRHPRLLAAPQLRRHAPAGIDAFHVRQLVGDALVAVDAGGLARQQEAGVISAARSEEHTSELQSLMRISYA